jgi:hypothetical protein
MASNQVKLSWRSTLKANYIPPKNYKIDTTWAATHEHVANCGSFITVVAGNKDYVLKSSTDEGSGRSGATSELQVRRKYS